MAQLGGQVALVTGGGQGVGQGIALALAAQGASVMLSGRTAEKLAATAALIRERGGAVDVIVGDVMNADARQGMIDATLSIFGGIDILVNNAQIVPLGRLMDVTADAFRIGFESGPVATLHLMQLAQPHMAQRGGGVIINLVSSAMVRWDMSGYGAYAAVKQAIASLTRAGAAEWGGDNIRVLAIAPHAESPALKWWINANPAEAEAFRKTIPLGRIGRLEQDIGDAVASLCSPAMGYLTGAIIPLDGGQARF